MKINLLMRIFLIIIRIIFTNNIRMDIEMAVKKLVTLAIILSSQASMAAESGAFELVIANHRFEPAQITVPAGR